MADPAETPTHSAENGTLRLPRKRRQSWPAQWFLAFGWRQFNLWSPKVWNRAVQATIRVLPRHGGCFIGVYVGRDEDDEREIRAGLGLIEVEATVLVFHDWRAHSDGNGAAPGS